MRAREVRFAHDRAGRSGGCRICRGENVYQNERKGAFLPAEDLGISRQKCCSSGLINVRTVFANRLIGIACPL